ncbi:hypothetical protein LUZ60_000531 [Juncus effusus]|nr:hypothetical protein LUZ60_000531 [Juncus effusus]
MKKLVRLPHFTTFLLRRFSTTSAASLRSLLSSPNPSHQTQALSLLSLQPRLLSPVSAQLLINLAETGSLSFPTNISQLTHIAINLSRHVGPTKALEFLRAVRKHGGVVFETRVFNSILNGFAREKDYDRMNQLLSEMKQMGVKPDVFTYGIIMNYLSKSGKIDNALKLLDEMSNPDSEVKPDLIMFNTVINGLCKVFRVKEEALCKNKDVKMAICLVNEMKERGVNANVTTFNAVLKGLRQEEGFEELGFEILDLMVKDKCRPNFVTIDLLINWLPKIGEEIRFKKFIEAFNDCGSNL